MTFVISDKCRNDKSCLYACPVDCIFQGKTTLVIDIGMCIDCGACAKVCRANAIYYEEDLPDSTFLDANREQSRDQIFVKR